MNYVKIKKFSLFDSPRSKYTIGNAVDIIEIANYVDFDPLADETYAVREMEKIVAENPDNNLPQVTFSGIVNSLQDKNLILHSGLICIDVDVDSFSEASNLKLKLGRNDPHVILCYISTNGKGVKAIFGMDVKANSQQEWFGGIAKYLIKTYNINENSIDTACSKPTRATYLAWDPTAFLKNNWNRKTDTWKNDLIPLIDNSFFS